MERKHHFVEKSWGRETWFENNDLYCGKELIVFKDEWSSKGKFHFHKIKDETFYVIRGILKLVVLDKDKEQIIELKQGESYRIKPGIHHKFTSITDGCTFIEVSTKHDDHDSYRI